MKDAERTVQGRETLAQAIAESQTEVQWLAQVIRMARDEGWVAYHVYEQGAYARRSSKGWPDVQLIRERLVFLELKGFQKDGKRGVLSRDQVRMITALRSAGQEVHVFWPDQEDEVRSVLHKRTRA